jgi:hypothetical protein
MYSVIHFWGGPELLIINHTNNLLMKMKLGNTDLVSAYLVCAISRIATIPPTILAATFMNMERRVGLCVQVDRNHFHHLL